MDQQIEAVLRSVVEFLQADRGILWAWDEENGDFLAMHYWRSNPNDPVPLSLKASSFPFVFEKVMRGETFSFSSLSDLPEEAWQERKQFTEFGTRAHVSAPMMAGNTLIGMFSIGATRNERPWPELLVRRIRVISDIFANAIQRKQAELDLEAAFGEIRRLKDRLEEENRYLRREVEVEYKYGEIAGRGEAIQSALRSVEQVAGTDATVLLLGETGTGKELLAHAIHNLSPRRDRAMVKVNCAALPPSLIESELFGREKGAYTGAVTRQAGRFELADGSTIFLDEIGDLPPEVQVKLLRVLQEGQFERLGSTRTIQVHVRVIAATNRDLEREVREGRFREDLYYRLSVFPIQVPPLRERKDDIPDLVWAFVKEFGVAMRKNVDSIPQRTMDALVRYPWPGNVRELRNVIERAMIVSTGSILRIDLPGISDFTRPPGQRLEEVEKAHILEVLNSTGWRVGADTGPRRSSGSSRPPFNPE